MTFDTNDYPWRDAGLGFDQWGYEYRNCTSFVAWRIFNDLHMPVPKWGNGGRFGTNAMADGVLVDSHPRVHDIACFLPNQNGAGPFGHVAIVTGLATGAGKIVINVEEYNFLNPLAYGTRIDVEAEGLQFIHYAAVVPTPTPPEEEVSVILATTQRTAGEGPDPHGVGAVYLVTDWPYGPKRWITTPAFLQQYEAVCGKVQVVNPFILDRMEEGPHIDATASPQEP